MERITTAAVRSHRPLLDLVGTGQVSMAGLGRVLDGTTVLDPVVQEQVAAAVAAEASRRVLTPGQLGKAADRRVLQANPDAAANRVTAARRDRWVRLGDPVDGTAGVYAMLRAEEAVAIWAGLDGIARAMRDHCDPRSLDTLRADLFVEYLTGRPLTRIPQPANPATPTDTDDTDDTAEHEPTLPVVWRSNRGVEPAFNQTPPPLRPDPDPDPDDPVWDHYLDPADPEDPESAGPPGQPPPAPAHWRPGGCGGAGGGGQTTAANEQGLGRFTNRVVKQRPDVQVRALPVDQRQDGLDGYRQHAPDIEWTLPSGQRHLSHPPPVLGFGSDPQDLTAVCPADSPDDPFGFWDCPGDFIDPADTAIDDELWARLEAATG